MTEQISYPLTKYAVYCNVTNHPGTIRNFTVYAVGNTKAELEASICKRTEEYNLGEPEWHPVEGYAS